MGHQINQFRIVPGGTNDKAQIILLWTYHVKPRLSGDVYNAEESKQYDNQQLTASGWKLRKMQPLQNEVFVYKNAMWADFIAKTVR